MDNDGPEDALEGSIEESGSIVKSTTLDVDCLALEDGAGVSATGLFNFFL